jgi:hypothetical protein
MGVEIDQLVLIAAVLGLMALANRVQQRLARPLAGPPAGVPDPLRRQFTGVGTNCCVLIFRPDGCGKTCVSISLTSACAGA